MTKNIIFDFDGTIVDTLDLALKFGNDNQERFAKRKVSKKDFQERSMREALKFMGLPWYKVPQFVLELKAHMKSHIDEIEPFAGIKETFVGLHRNGYKLFVLSSNSQENIESVLTRMGVREHFSDIVSDSSIFGKHVVLDRLLKKNLSIHLIQSMLVTKSEMLKLARKLACK